MNIVKRIVVAAAVLAVLGTGLSAADWPQWRGPDRDGKIPGFKSPASWPASLVKKWTVKVGVGDSSPLIVGEKAYAFARDGGDEVTVCLKMSDQSELWRDKNPAPAISGPAARAHAGPRSTPAVGGGKIVTLGVNGVLSCLDAEKGAVVWRKNDIKGTPQFYTSSSPLIVDDLVIAQLGAEGNGAIVAYKLADGAEKWKCAEGPGYSSPMLMTADGVKQIVTLTDKKVVGVSPDDGSLLWSVDFVPARMSYNAATPIIDGSTVIVSGKGRGTKALKIEKKDGKFAATEVWSNSLGVQFCTPVLKDGFVYGVSDAGEVFCLDAKDGKTAWHNGAKLGQYGAVLDAGEAILILTEKGEMFVVKPDGKAYTEPAKYKLAETSTYACPAVVGKQVLVKDQDSLILWSLD